MQGNAFIVYHNKVQKSKTLRVLIAKEGIACNSYTPQQGSEEQSSEGSYCVSQQGFDELSSKSSN